MGLEILFNPKKAEGHPVEMFLVGLVYSVTAAILAFFLFRNHASMVMVAITIAATIPIVYNIIKLEAKKDFVLRDEYKLLKEHEKAVITFTFLFLGFVAGFLAIFIISPAEFANNLFKAQIDSILSITGSTGLFHGIGNKLLTILANNIRVLVFSILFSLLFGAGALFILSWNASIMAAAMGSFIKTELAAFSNAVGFAKGAAYFGAFSLSLLRYALHGIPEIFAYFIGGLAGGIVFNALLRKKITKSALYDLIILLSIAVGILFAAALIEVFVTPTVVDWVR